MFEDQALSSAQNRPRMWKRYVDDTFCIMEKRHVKAFLVHLNSLRPSIQFTMEMEENNSLSFLDTLVKRGDGGMIDFGVYRKPTHMDRYLQYSSHHPCHVKRGMVSVCFTEPGQSHKDRTGRERRNTSLRYCKRTDTRMKWSGLHLDQDCKGCRRSSHAIPSTSPMYQA